MRAKGFLYTVGRGVTSLNKWIIVITALALIAAIVVEIIARFIFHFSITGHGIIACGVAAWLWFSGMAEATRREYHVGGRFPVERESVQRRIKLVDISMNLIVSIVFCIFAIRYNIFTIMENARDVSLGFNLIYIRISVLFGLVLTVAYCINNLQRKIKGS